MVGCRELRQKNAKCKSGFDNAKFGRELCRSAVLCMSVLVLL